MEEAGVPVCDGCWGSGGRTTGWFLRVVTCPDCGGRGWTTPTEAMLPRLRAEHARLTKERAENAERERLEREIGELRNRN